MALFDEELQVSGAATVAAGLVAGAKGKQQSAEPWLEGIQVQKGLLPRRLLDQ
jgi:hypothetical protein